MNLRITHQNHLGLWASVRVGLDKSSQGSDALGLGRDIGIQQRRVLKSLNIDVDAAALNDRSNFSNHTGASWFGAGSSDDYVNRGTIECIRAHSEGREGREQSEKDNDNVHLGRLKTVWEWVYRREW